MTPDDKSFVIAIMDERDRRYNDRFIAQEKALQLALDAKRGAIGVAVSVALSLIGTLIAVASILLGRGK